MPPMFRPTDPQTSLLECEYLLPAEKAARLKKSWAEPFRTIVMPLIDEEAFRDAFSSATGRPNKSIRLLVGLHLLKEFNDLTDEQVLDHFEYNLQWHYALGVEPATAHVCQKTLHNFRVILMENDRARRMFEQVTRGLADSDGLNLGRQRLDSTHVISNIAVLTRLGLFVETVTTFLRELRNELPDRLSALEPGFEKRYLDREGYFADARREQAKRRLSVVAADVHSLMQEFDGESVVSGLAAYRLLRRLFEEQCEVVVEEEDDQDGDVDDGGDGEAAEGSSAKGPRVRLREPKTISSQSLQSPHDPDATYGRKGKGYEVQVAESCSEDNPYEVVTGTSVGGAHESDQKALRPMLDQLESSGMMPEELLADTGYGSGANIVESAERGVDLQAPVQDPDGPAPKERFDAPLGSTPAPLTPPMMPDDPLTDTGHEGGANAASAERGVDLEAPAQAPDGPAPTERPDARPCSISASSTPALSDTIEPSSTSGIKGHRPVESESELPFFSFLPTFDAIIECAAGHSPHEQHMAGRLLYATFSADVCLGCSQADGCPCGQLASGDRQLRRAPATIATAVRHSSSNLPPSRTATASAAASNRRIKS